MSEMIERVAKAMFIAEQPDGEPFNEFRWGHTSANYRLLARAAIEAMREPTPEMYTAAYAANGGRWADDEYEPPPNVCWPTMIDAALGKKS